MSEYKIDEITAKYLALPVGTRVVITAPFDDADPIHAGVVTAWATRPDGVPTGWVEVLIDGEHTRDEWPAERVWPESPS